MDAAGPSEIRSSVRFAEAKSETPSTSRKKRGCLDDLPTTFTPTGGKPTFYPFEGREEAIAKTSAGHYVREFYQFAKAKQQRRELTFTWLDWLGFFIPMVRWLRIYNVKSYLVSDLIAGLCVGFMVVPQGMSYAATAGLPSVYGLYGAFSPVLVYAFIGSSRQLAVGPVAVTSQILHVQLVEKIDGASGISNPNTVTGPNVQIQEAYNHAAVQVAFLVACMYTAIGVFRLGFITNFLSHSVIGGFISANAVCIGLGQLKGILGIPLPSPAPVTLNGLLSAYFAGLHNLVWQTTLFGFSLVVMMWTMRWIGGMHPRLVYVRALAPLTACIVGLIAQYTIDVASHGIPLVGPIPAGLPPVTVGWWFSSNSLGQLVPTAIIIMAVDLLESTSIARAVARKNNYVLAANQEIVGLGIANFVGAAFNAYTTTGSFSRTAVNQASGARTQVSSLVSALVVGAVLLFLTGVFQNMPYCVLGAIVIAAMPPLFEYEQLIYLWKVDKLDALCWLASFLGVLFISVEIGLAISIGLALLLVVFRSAFPAVRVLGRLGDSTTYRSATQFGDVGLTPGVLCYLIDASIYYANQQSIKDTAELLRERYSTWSTSHGVSLAYVIIDMSSVLHVDSSGTHALEDILSDMATHNVQVLLANPSRAVLRAMELAGLPDLLGREFIFVSVHDAHLFCRAKLQEQGFKTSTEDGNTFSIV